jgi:hypothetical protein
MTAFAIELEVARALVEADVGEIDLALRRIVDARDECASIASEIGEVWARTAEGYIRLRIDPGAARPMVEDTLVRARAIEYPIGIAVNLRSLAFAHIAGEEWRAATAALVELSNEIASTGALADLGLLLDASAVLCHRCGAPEWEQLAATAASVPVVSLAASVGYPLFPLPDPQAAPLSRRKALSTARSVLARIAADLEQPTQPQRRTDAFASAAPATGALVRRGDVWDVDYAGRTVTVRESKGVTDLAQLLAAVGREIHCLDLFGASVREASTGEVIDAEARRSYEHRIRELQADIDSAEADNDYVRAERAQTELDTLVDHLTAALGQGGRTRRAGDTAEKARSAVTQRLRSTIRRLEAIHPELGRHLHASITTGTYCRYEPERPTTWRVTS